MRIRRPGVILKLFFLVGRDVVASNIAVALGVLRALPVSAAKFFLVGRDVVASNIAVAWGVLRAGKNPPRSRFIKIPLDL